MQKINYYILTKSVGLYVNCLSFINLEKAKHIAYKLFSQPRKGKLHLEHLPKTLIKAKRESFVYDHETFQTYIWPGNEEVVVLVHGWESNAGRWKKLLHHLIPTKKTIIALDAPAHGLADGTEFNAPRYAEFIHLVCQKYNPQTLIGHSIGGAAICYYLHKNPTSSIQKVVLLGAPSSFKKISDNFIQMLSLRPKIQLRLEQYYQEKFNIHIDDFSGHKFAQHFTQKALIVHDHNDQVIPVLEGQLYAQSWPNSRYIETTGLGHSMHDDTLYQQLVAFIQES
jgi:pimeloyl-ACP methyl ester carboxylesterase